ncbi:MAG TPA: D-alanine--D-alanine ligase family protein, partial [Trueperaceae bacterium]
MSKPRVLLLCGGESGEHEVSLSSARSVIAAVGERFAITPLVIDKAGRLLPPDSSLEALGAGRAEAGAGSLRLGQLANGNGRSDSFDVVFPLLHGPNGEDGTVQGLLELLDLPYVGSGVLGSAVGMDKLMMKSVFAAEGLPQVDYRGITRSRWHGDRAAVLDSLDLPWPLFVKPANLGSSVGIAKARDREQLEAALDDAFRFDRRVIVEQGVDGARELEVGVLGNDDARVSPVGEIRFQSEFYDYGTKYTEGRSQLSIPAQVPARVAERCQRIALRAFGAIDAAGLARVDFFYLEQEDRLLLNEINTMPGFTVTSMYPKLWEAAGLSYADLVARLVELAL